MRITYNALGEHLLIRSTFLEERKFFLKIARVSSGQYFDEIAAEVQLLYL